MRKQDRSTFEVVSHRKEKHFVAHGMAADLVTAIPALVLEPGGAVEVLRAGQLLDTGEAKEMGGHDGSTRFGGLDKIVPSEARWYRSMPATTGVTDPLLAEWFEEGDIVRLEVTPEKVREIIRAFPDLWKRPQSREDKIDEDSIRALSQNFCGAWNSSNLELACEAYAEDATYVSKDHGVVQGKTTILGLYRAIFPKKASMGTLELEMLECRIKRMNGTPVSASAIFAWSIHMPDHRVLTGFGLEVYEVRDGQLKIVQDATM